MADNGSQGNDRSRQPRRSGPPPLEARAALVLRELRAIGRALGERSGLSPGEPLPLEHLVLPVALELHGRPDGAADREQAAQLVRDFAHRLDEALKASDSFLPGRVYCFQCDTSRCPHAAPADRAETFRGYTATGKPQWQSFLNLCLERGEPRVDQLYADPPEVIALLQTATELKGELLPAFGRDSLAFNVLGQVVMGLVPLHLGRARNGDARVALTVQVVETRRGDGRYRLRLNLLGLESDHIAGGAAERPRDTADRLAQTLRAARHQVDVLARRLIHAERRGERLSLAAEVEPLLVRLRSELEKVCRPARHRTRHAHERHLGGDRPTASALRDAREAREDSLFRDAERNTIVVIGRRGRAHVFSPEGRHVTSLQLEPGELERKSGKNRWQPLDRNQLEDFRAKIG